MNINQLIKIGGTLMFVSGLLMCGVLLFFKLSVFAVLAPMIIGTVGIGLVMPNSLAGSMEPFKNLAGTAAALQGFMRFATAAAVTSMIGYFNGIAFAALSITTVICALICIYSSKITEKELI